MILWIERFLPTPAPLPLDPQRSATARRRAALVPLLVFPMVVAPILVREKHQFGAILSLNHTLLAQLTLVMAGCVAIAAIGFGVKAWRDAKGAR